MQNAKGKMQNKRSLRSDYIRARLWQGRKDTPPNQNTSRKNQI